VEEEAEGPRLTEVRRLALKPMSVDEAILQVELGNHGFLVFRDTETDQLCVIQRLSDGNYGLMEISG
jgi:putative sigma-54 modulation protein